MLSNYFKTALRNLLRNKVYSFINIAGLSLGLTCAMLIVLYVKDEVSYDRFHKDVNQIYRIGFQEISKDGAKGRKDAITGYFQGPRFTQNIPEIKSFVRVQGGNRDIKSKGEIYSQELSYVDSSFFSVFSFPLLSGDPKTALVHPQTVVLSETEAIKQFGTTDAVGKTILFEENKQFVPYTVTAVAKKCPQNSSIKFDVLLPMIVSKEDEQNSENWFNFFLNTFIVLKPTANVQAVERKMKMVYEKDAASEIKAQFDKYGVTQKWAYLLQPYTAMHLSTEMPAQNGLSGNSNPVFSYILSGIAVFILLIACINFINLTVARSVKRAKEIGVRKVVGSGRKQLIVQFMGESFILCFIAFVLALVVVQLILPVFNDLSNKALAFSYLLDAKLIGGYILLFILTGLLAGFYPALVLSKYNPTQTLYGRFAIAGKNYLQKSLVVTQFALASFLIIATLTIFSQFNYLTNAKLGYDDTDLVGVQKWDMNREQAQVLKNELKKNPNIVEVAPKNGGFWGTMAKVNGEKQLQFAYETVDETYLPLLKVSIIQGRNFSADYPSDSSHSVIVNEAFVKEAGWKDPLNQVVDFWYHNKKYNVIGVVKDYHFEGLGRKIGPQLFTMKKDNGYGIVFIKIKPHTETASLQYIEKVFKKMFPINPYVYKFKHIENLENYQSEAKWKTILLFGAVLTIFISAIGLFGLSVLSAEKRTKEIGIRKVLGASVGGVVTLLSKDFLKLIIVSFLISMPVAWWATNKWLENYPYRINVGWGIFTATGIMVLIIALATVSFQAIKVAMANPVKSLRTE
ncbi:ABC transporter permease [Solitalea sp. MAHUQ-68]|uniref:ABC transporter permease n=1 Tax=Solitalea agri TaxID=2953739 RepID=A0A9X2JCI5_9SPHI|nr:ABC transporter permease [Solitalea agri]MCO4291835.1 ABC transporter permease [Solitalea agri]